MPLHEGSSFDALADAVRLHAGEGGLDRLRDICGGKEVELGATLSPTSSLARALGLDAAEKVRKELLLFDADENVVRFRCYVPNHKTTELRDTIKALLIEGLSSVEVAERAGVGLRTVFRHVKRLRNEGCNAPMLVRHQPLIPLDAAIIEGGSLDDVARKHKRTRAYVFARADKLAARGAIPVNPYAALPAPKKRKGAKAGRRVALRSSAPRAAREARP